MQCNSDREIIWILYRKDRICKLSLKFKSWIDGVVQSCDFGYVDEEQFESKNKLFDLQQDLWKGIQIN